MRQLLLTALTLAALPALAQDTGLTRCRALTDAGARLACYDALADAAVPAGAPRAATVAAPPAATGALAPAAGVASGEVAANFGRAAPSQEPDMIQSAVGPSFNGWEPNQRIKLLNGQEWQVTDGTSATVPAKERKVAVRRGWFGAYFLEVEGLNASPRVRRVQ